MVILPRVPTSPQASHDEAWPGRAAVFFSSPVCAKTDAYVDLPLLVGVTGELGSSLCLRNSILLWFPSSFSRATPRSLTKPQPQLLLLLRHLPLEPVDGVLERLLALRDHLGPERRAALQLPPPRCRPCLATRRLPPRGGFVLAPRPRRRAQPTRLELRAGLERLDPPRLPVQVSVCAVEEQRHKGADLGAEGSLGGGEGGCGDEFVVLFSIVVFQMSAACAKLAVDSIARREVVSYADSLEHVAQSWKVGDARVQGLNGRLEEGERGAQRRDAVAIRLERLRCRWIS